MDKWDERFMRMAEEVAGWSSCFKQDRHVGAVITKDKRILTTGYNGASSGVMSCVEKGECIRVKMGIPSGTRHEMCYHPSCQDRRIRQRRDAVLYASAVHNMRQDDYQRRYQQSGIQARLSGRIQY